MTPADHCRQMRLCVGDTIEGREEWPTGWHDARLTLLWMGQQEAVWQVRCRSHKKPDWSPPFEAVGWKLNVRRWRKVAHA
jgi:hypothetical protein